MIKHRKITSYINIAIILIILYGNTVKTILAEI